MFFRKKQLFYTQEKKPRRFLRSLGRLTILLLVLGISTGVYLKFFTESAGASWFDENWLYRQSTTVTNGGSTVTDYQIAIPLDTATLISAGKMQSTCNDIRITDVNGKILPIWIETGAKACNTSSTAIWTKAASLPAGTSTFYIYYGNTSAPNIQSGDKVFEFFDDFSGTTLNPGKWTTGTAAATVGTDFTVGSGVLSGGNSNRYVQSAQPFTGNYIAETRENTTTQNANGFSTIGFWATSSNNFGILDHNSTSYYRNDAGWVNFSYNGTGQWNRDKVKVVGTSATYYRTGETSGSSTNTATNSGISGEYLRIGARYDGGVYNQNFVATWDFIIVRKAVATEPTIGAPASEEKGPQPVAYWKFDGNLLDQTSNKNHAVAGMSSALTPNYVDGISGSAIDFTTSDWSTNLSYVSSTVVQDSTKSWTTDQWAGYSLVSNYEAVGGYCRRLIVSNTATSLTLNGACNSWSGTKAYRIKKVMWVQDSVNYGTTNVTLESWYRRTASKADTSNTLVRFSGDDMGIEVYDSSITGYVNGYVNGFSCTVAGTDKKWHHVSITYDGATVKLYYDGKLCNTRSQVSTLSNNENVMIGTRTDGYSAFFEGYIDDMKLYPYTRTDDDIKADFNSRGSGGASTSVLGSASNNNNALSNGLVGYWKMDESSWNGTANEVRDASGNGNNGTSTNGATIGAGKYGNGGNFTTSQYVSIPHSSSLALDDQVTLSAWVYPSSNSGYRFILDKRGACSTLNYEIYTNGGDLRFAVGPTEYSSGSTLTLNTWQHVTATFDDTTNSLSFYINGVRVNTQTATDAMTPTTNALNISDNGCSAPWAGTLDDARIYNRALSPSEVTSLYNFAPGPAAAWNFEEGNSSTVSDISGNNNTLTWSGTGSRVTSGKIGKAAVMNGVDDYLSTSLASVDFSKSYTVSQWINPSRYGDTRSNCGNKLGVTFTKQTSYYGVTFMTQDSTQFSYTHTKADISGSTSMSSSLSLNAWNYMTAVYDATGNTMKLYRNGQLVQSTNTTGITYYSPSGNLYIGGHNNNCSFGYPQGAIDDTKVYNYARSAKQILDDMQGSRPAVNGRGTGTVGYWKFDEGNGISAKDYSGNGNSGTLTSMVSPAIASSGWSNNGKFGKALSFDGSNDYVDKTTTSSLEIASDTITLSAWIKPTTWNTNDYIVAKYSGGSDGYGMGLTAESGTQDLKAFVTTGGISTIVYADLPSRPTGTWHHMLARYDGKNIAIYWDGVLINQSAKTGNITPGSGNLTIGRLPTVASSFFDGQIDEVKIYNFALTEDDVKKDFNRGSIQTIGSLGTDASGVPSDSSDRMYCPPGDTTATCGPVGEWNFEEGQGTATNDISGNGNAGTLNNNATWASGKVGKSVLLDGVGDYVGAGNASNLQVSNGTMEAWIKTTNAGTTYRGIVVKQYAYGMFLVSNVFSLYDWGTASTRSTGINLADGNWHHVAATFQSGVANGTLLYIDGVLKLTTTMTISNQAAALSFGTGSGTNNGQDFTGNIDQVKVYNYVRTPAQIAWDYNRGAPVAWYKMDECQGTSVRDMTGNGNNGTLTVGASGTQTSAGTCQTSSTAWGNGASGKVNYSLNFDGTDDYFTIPQPSIALAPNSFTVTGWIKPGNQASRFITPYSNGIDQSVAYSNTGQSLQVLIAESTDVNTRTRNSTTGSVPLNTWSHFAVSINDKSIRIYINGRLDSSYNESINIGDWSGVWYIGQRGNSANWHLGQIDDIRVYNYPLTLSQVKDVYNGGAVKF